MATLRELFFTNTTTRHTVIRNGFWRSFSIGFNKLIRLLAILLAARWLGPTLFGEYSYVVSLMTLAFIFSDWGINLLLTRDLQQKKDGNKVFSVALAAKLLINIAAAIVGLALPFFVSGAPVILCSIIVASMVVGNIRELFVNAIIARQRGELEAIVSVLEGILTVFLIFTLLTGYRTGSGFALINLITNSAALVICIGLVYHWLGFRFKYVSPSEITLFLKAGLPLALFGIIGYIFFASDQLFIKHYLGIEQVGYYALATRVIYAAQLLPSLIVSVLFPVISRYATDRERLEPLFKKIFWLLVGIGALVAGIIFIAKPLLIIAAPQYLSALPIVSGLSGILIFMFPSVWLDSVLVALNKQKQDFYLTFGAAGLNIILLFILVQPYGFSGAVYATIISQAINTVATYIYAWLVIQKIQPAKIMA